MMRLLLTLCALLITLPVQAAEFDLTRFSALPVQQDGRIKPLDSFARAQLKQASGAETLGDKTASAFLAEALFTPEKVADEKLFAVPHPDVRTLLKLDPAAPATKRYSLNELAPGLAATSPLLPALLDENTSLTQSQNELLSVHDRALGLLQVMQALDMTKKLENGETFLTLANQQDEIDDALKNLVRRKGENVDKYTDTEKAQAALGLELQTLRDAGAKNTLFRVVPPQWGNDSAWVSPWALLLQGQGSPQGIAILTAWNDAAKAYRESDQAAFDAAMAEIAKASKDQTDRKRLAVELAYNQAQPFDAAQSLYIVALTLTVFGMLRPANIALRPLSLAAAGLGVTAHIAGIAMRIYILGRPPVGTLYESLLFVSVIVMLAALTIEAARKDRLALLAGCGVATFLLQLAPAVAPQGDSLHVLVAVLNTNFWLATHVVCITAGYGACVLAGSLAHVALYGGVRAADRLLPLLHKTLLAGLFLTAFGTVLGGIWADQSWGRFWGWDPKENGALLIVLWIAWLLHGRMAGFLKQPLYLALVCALNIVVALAWFGVNLLGVGLHSYGFITGIAAGLAAFCFVEIALIVLGAIRYQRA